jgi:hypothetical protein
VSVSGAFSGRISVLLIDFDVTPFRWVLTILSFATAIGVSVAVIVSSWPEQGGAPLGLPWWSQLLLLGSVGLEIVCRVLKIVFSAKAIGVPVTFSVAARTILAGDFAAAITPSRSGTEPARYLVLSEAGVRGAGAVLILFLELFLEILSLLVIAGISALIINRVGSGGEGGAVLGLLATVGAYAALVMGAAAFVFSLAKSRTSGPPPGWTRLLGIGPGAWRRIQGWLRQLRESVGALRRADRWATTIALGFSIIHVAARLLPLPIVVYSYAPAATIPLGQLVLWQLVLLYGAAVAPAPGGGGVVELAFKASLGSTIPDRLLGTSLIWWRVYSFYVYIAIGALATGRTVMRALRRTARAIED